MCKTRKENEKRAAVFVLPARSQQFPFLYALFERWNDPYLYLLSFGGCPRHRHRSNSNSNGRATEQTMTLYLWYSDYVTSRTRFRRKQPEKPTMDGGDGIFYCVYACRHNNKILIATIISGGQPCWARFVFHFYSFLFFFSFLVVLFLSSCFRRRLFSSFRLNDCLSRRDCSSRGGRSQGEIRDIRQRMHIEYRDVRDTSDCIRQWPAGWLAGWLAEWTAKPNRRTEREQPDRPRDYGVTRGRGE